MHEPRFVLRPLVVPVAQNAQPARLVPNNFLNRAHNQDHYDRLGDFAEENKEADCDTIPCAESAKPRNACTFDTFAPASSSLRGKVAANAIPIPKSESFHREGACYWV